jgi:hypothetical protein
MRFGVRHPGRAPGARVADVQCPARDAVFDDAAFDGAVFDDVDALAREA